MIVASVTCWSVISGVLAIVLHRDYSRGRVQLPTEILLWTWHALNYTLLVLFAVEGTWELDLPDSVRIIGWAAAGGGAAIIAAGFYEFRSARRLTGSRQDTVIDSGVYRFSRHPQYLGIIFTLLGGALAGDSGAALLFALGLSTVLLLYIPIEERFASKGLGEAYERYRLRAPLLVGKPR